MIHPPRAELRFQFLPLCSEVGGLRPSRPADPLPLSLGTFHARSDPLRENSTLELGIRRRDVVQCLAERACGVQPRFAIGAQADAPCPEPLERGRGVEDRTKGAINSPNQNKVEVPPRGPFQEVAPGYPRFQINRRRLVYELANDRPCLRSRELAEGEELRFEVLVLVPSGDPCVDRDAEQG